MSSIFNQKVKDTSTTSKDIEAGSYGVVISKIIDLGMCSDTFDGQTKTNHKLWVDFTFMTEEMESEEGTYLFHKGKEITLTMSDKGNLL